MAHTNSITCDVCTRARTTPLGWLLYTKSEGKLAFYEWNDADAQAMGHLCGPECTKELVGKTLAGWRTR